MESTSSADAQGALELVEYRRSPSVLILADSERGRDSWLRAARLADCRIADSAPLAGGAERLDLQVAADAVLVAVEADSGDALDEVLARLDEGTTSGRFGSAVAMPLALLDRVT